MLFFTNLGSCTPNQINQNLVAKATGFFIASEKISMLDRVEALIIGVSNKATIAGGATAVIGGTVEKVNEVSVAVEMGTRSMDIGGMCAIGGLILAILGYMTSIYFQLRRENRETRESEWRMGIDADRREP